MLKQVDFGGEGRLDFFLLICSLLLLFLVLSTIVTMFYI